MLARFGRNLEAPDGLADARPAMDATKANEGNIAKSKMKEWLKSEMEERKRERDV